MLFPTQRQITHVLLTRAPLSGGPKPPFAFDLHVLGTPPALILSQDQTLKLNSLIPPKRPKAAKAEHNSLNVDSLLDLAL